MRDGSANLHAANRLYSQKVIGNYHQRVPDEDIDEILQAKDALLDIMGVYQHHDAVSGTERQHVANNYVEKLSKAMNANNKVYSKRLTEHLATMAGLYASDF